MGKVEQVVALNESFCRPQTVQASLAVDTVLTIGRFNKYRYHVSFSERSNPLKFNVADGSLTLSLLALCLSACHAPPPSGHGPITLDDSVYDLGAPGGGKLSLRFPQASSTTYSTQASVSDIDYYTVILTPYAGPQFIVEVQPVAGDANLLFTNVPAGIGSIDIKAYDTSDADITSSVAYSGVSVVSSTGPTSAQLSIQPFPVPNAFAAVVQLVNTVMATGFLDTAITALSGSSELGPLAIAVDAGTGSIQATSSVPL